MAADFGVGSDQKMARRRQLKGIAGNLAQWCLSRNFDSEGYWAVGKLYAAAKELGVSEIVFDAKKQTSCGLFVAIKILA